MAPSRGLTGWRRREAAHDALERREARRPLSSVSKDQITYWTAQNLPQRLQFVYFLTEDCDDQHVKIGSAFDPEGRACELQTGNPRRLVVRALLLGDGLSERVAHNFWRQRRGIGEWFSGADEILDWAYWAARVQRIQFDNGLDFYRVVRSYGKSPDTWRQEAA